MHHPSKNTVFAALVGLMLTAGPARAETIYNESFGGSGNQKLHRTSPDIGAEAWTASKAWKANGTIAQTPSAKKDDSAFLPFVPSPGNVYTLTATVTVPAGGQIDADWIGLGFTNAAETGSTTINNKGFFANPNDASPWVLYRGTTEVKTFAGPGATASAIEGQFAGPTITLSIQLDTRAAEWAAEWFVDGSSVRTETFVSNPPIAYVGFGRDNGASSTLSSFELTTSPDSKRVSIPESDTYALLAGLTGLACVMLRRRR